MVQGWPLGSSHLVAPVATNSCGTSCWFMYFQIAVFVGVPALSCDYEDLILFDQLARHLDGFGRRIGVVVGDEIDLAAVDATLGIDHFEVRRLAFPNRAVI